MSTDAELVTAVIRGDSSAFGKLAERYRDAAFGIAYAKLGDFEAARDAAQDALVTACRDIRTLRDPSKFAGWLRNIALTSAVDILRRRKAVISLDDPRVPEPVDVSQDPERSSRAIEVREALAAIPEPDRLALILHYINGYTHAEIGSMLETTVSAVKSRIHRAKGLMREEMREMVEQTLKESVLEQLHLPKLSFRTDYSRFDPAYREFLEIEVTEVYGSSALPRVGDNYLICGRYALKEHEPIKLFACAANSTSTGIRSVPAARIGRVRDQPFC